VAALPSFGQSAILGVSAERQHLELVDGTVRAQAVVTLTLAYDHTLCDGVYAAEFLADVVSDLGRAIGN
jgi:pyruvate/2-oxoglutarate dehydrogenase complex dihydrolipoamide acyltransferase (E2) component